MPRRNGSGIAVLADPTRLRLIALIAVRPRRSSALARELRIGRPATSRHLKVMCDAGLIEWRPSLIDGRWRVYAIRPSRHGAITAWLAGTEIGLTGAANRPTTDARGETTPHD